MNMNIYTKLPENLGEVDLIIAGGGTAGCIVAGRVAEADPTLSILVIESGKNNYEDPSVVHPALFGTNLRPDSDKLLFYVSNKAQELAGRHPVITAGNVLGGGSSVNAMMYSRAQRSDYDSWNTPGWTTAELLPFMKKLETFHGPDPSNSHGDSGPVHVSDGPYRSRKLEDDFLQAAAQLGWPEIPDLHDLDANDGFERWKKYVSPDGRRQDTAHTYLHPKLRDGRHPNLHVLVESNVVRVLLDDNKRAVGVEYTPNVRFQPPEGSAAHPKRAVKARKMVVVSSGACGTPLVLERSGLGDPEVLQRAGVRLCVNLPGVGREYEDHTVMPIPYLSALGPGETLDALVRGREDAAVWIKNKDKKLGWNGIDISSKLRPTDADVKMLGPKFEAAWKRDFKDAPDRPLMHTALIAGWLLSQPLGSGQYVTAVNYTAYPYSRGHIHITGPEVGDALDFDAGFLSDPDGLDLKKQVWAYKKQREILRRTQMYRGEEPSGHPRFPAGSPAACIQTAAPLTDVRDLRYSADDDAAIEQWLRKNIQTAWHSLGTAKMAPREQHGVVNAALDVHGTERLKLADLSIAPANVAGNTNNTALVIGEKAADIIVKELGCDGRSRL